MNDIDMSDCSSAACIEYPEPDRSVYFNDEDYESALRRVAQKRKQFDRVRQASKVEVDEDYNKHARNIKDPFKTNPAKSRVKEPNVVKIAGKDRPVQTIKSRYYGRKQPMSVKTLSIDGTIFTGVTAVAKAYDMTVVEVSDRIYSKDWPTWKYNEN
jgi:hypothetical protein